MSSIEVLRVTTLRSDGGGQEHSILDMQGTDEEPNGSAFKNETALPLSPTRERSLTFHDVSYQVSACCGRRTKCILDSCSGIMRPGLNAVMGPTGSGKTTLLDVLADRKGRTGWSGFILVNGRQRPKNFKCVSGYVVQDDLMLGTLSVRENLQFSATLRLPSHMTRQQRRKRVERVISELGLESCADTKIGSEFFRGVSGGERKRTSIGMELIIEPEVLFLDEPTTGLDAHTAVSVVKLLKKLSQSQGQRIIILSIHQPRYSIFSLFNSLTLLSQGQMVYHGDSQQVLPYFQQLGHSCGQHENPADFILDVLTLCEKGICNVDEIKVDLDSDIQLTMESEERSMCGEKVAMAEKYQQTEMFRDTNRQLEDLLQQLKEREEKKEEPPTHSAAYARSIFWQALVVTSRSAKALLRDPISFYFQVIIMMIFALLVGIIYFDLDGKTLSANGLHNAINDRAGAFFFMIMNQIFSNMSAVDLFIRRKALFIHENASGYYRVSVFFFSQIAIDLIAKRILPVLVFCIITYFMIGLQLEAGKFFIYLLTMFMVSLTAASITYAYSSVARVTAVATLLSALTFVLSMLFGGFLIALTSLPEWLRWIKYLSLFRYGLEALSINELRGQQFHVTNTSTDTCIPLECIDGTESLSGLGYETAAEWIWYDQMALAVLSTIFLTICFFNLQLIKKHK